MYIFSYFRPRIETTRTTVVLVQRSFAPVSSKIWVCLPLCCCEKRKSGDMSACHAHSKVRQSNHLGYHGTHVHIHTCGRSFTGNGSLEENSAWGIVACFPSFLLLLSLPSGTQPNAQRVSIDSLHIHDMYEVLTLLRVCARFAQKNISISILCCWIPPKFTCSTDFFERLCPRSQMWCFLRKRESNGTARPVLL